MTVLSDEARRAALADLAGWDEVGAGEAIARTFRFADFNAAFGWMVRVALAAEKANHHPDWTNVYNRVEVRLSTHDAGGVTGKDVTLAKLMNAYAGEV